MRSKGYTKYFHPKKAWSKMFEEELVERIAESYCEGLNRLSRLG